MFRKCRVLTRFTRISGAAFGRPSIAALIAFASTITLATPSIAGAANGIVSGADAGGGPHVAVFDGVSGAVLRSFFAYSPAFGGGVRVAVGDVNGDGVGDIVTGAGPGGGPHVEVFDGATGALIRSFFAYAPSFSGGVFVAAGDLNGDGRADIVTGAGAGGGPHVEVFDGATGAVSRSFFAYSPAFGGGVRVAAGDVNGDGRVDIVTGAGAGGGPHVEVFDGVTGAVSRSFFAYAPAWPGGVYVGAGDVNGDGRADIVTGAGAGGGPHVEVFDGVSNAVIRSFFAYNSAFGGGVRVAAADLNGDGKAEIITGAGPGGGPHVEAFDGATNSVIRSFFAESASFTGGIYVGGGLSPTAGGPCGGLSSMTPPSTYTHVVWIWMENHAYSQVIGSSSAPYENQLATQCGLATNYSGVSHPSLPNYVAATSGDTQGITDDNPPSSHPLGAQSIFGQVTSGSFQDSMPTNCDKTDVYPYAVKHNPEAYYTPINALCQMQDAPLTSMDPNNLPAFSFVTPNLCNDTHDCAVNTGDAWLQNFIPRITGTADYKAGKTAIFLTWDEDDGSSGNHVPTIVLSPYTTPGTQSGTPFNHSSLLRTTEELLGQPLLGNAASATSMAQAFHLAAATPPPTSTTSQPLFSGLASTMNSLTCGNPDAEGPQVWGGLEFIASDGSTCDVQLVSDARYGKAYRYRVGDASYAPYYDPGPNKGTAELTIIRPPHLGQWDWYAMGIKLDPTWQQPTWALFFEPMFPRYTTPPEQIASGFRDSSGAYCYTYSACDKSTVWWLFSRLDGNLSNLQRQDVWLQPAELGKGTEFVFGIKWALDTSGAYKVYTRVPADGQTSFTLRASATGVVTYQTDGGPIPANLTDIMALYEGNEPPNGWPALPTNIAYHTGFRRYNDEASALAAFGP